MNSQNNYFNDQQTSTVKSSSQLLNNSRNNDSIINELNLLQNGCTFQSRVVKVESFIYAQQDRGSGSPYQQLHDSFVKDQNGDIIPPIVKRNIQNYNKVFEEDNKRNRYEGVGPSTSVGIYNRNKEEGRGGKKSIREEIMQENRLLEKRLSMGPGFSPVFTTARSFMPRMASNQAFNPKDYQKQIKLQHNEQSQKIQHTSIKALPQQSILKLQEQYNKSKIIKLYNFIMRELPECKNCQGYCTHLGKELMGSSLKCKQCAKDGESEGLHPLVGILYDLENKSRFEEQTANFQSILDLTEQEIQKLRVHSFQLQQIHDKIMTIKGLNRKKFKQINQAKFYLKKHIGNLQSSNIKQLQKLLPRQYLQQMDQWQQIKQNYCPKWDNIYQQIYKIMPLYFQDSNESKLISNLHKILNYEKQQPVKISISQHVRFPMKRMESAVFLVDGAYNLPVFQNINHLQLQFQNKKTLRELNMLFSNFPRSIYSLSFAYNHKIHSHISAETFPFLKSVAPFQSIKKLSVRIDNMKQFQDLQQMVEVMTPKMQFKLIITRHLFSKQQLMLPQTFYDHLLSKLGQDLVKFQLELPQSSDSPAKINYQQLTQCKNLCVFKVDRGEKQNIDKKKQKILQNNQTQIQISKKKQLILKKQLSQRLTTIMMIKKLSFLSESQSKSVIQSVLSMLI